MGKQIQGECNYCGHCGCYSDTDIKWVPGIPYSLFDWGRMHPESEEPAITAIKSKAVWQRGDVDFGVKIRIAGIPGQIDIWVSKDGIQRSATDRNCPFRNDSDGSCILYGKPYRPSACVETPQNLKEDDEIAKWQANHPDCGYYWVDV